MLPGGSQRVSAPPTRPRTSIGVSCVTPNGAASAADGDGLGAGAVAAGLGPPVPPVTPPEPPEPPPPQPARARRLAVAIALVSLNFIARLLRFRSEQSPLPGR